MSHQQYTSLTHEIPENRVIDTRYGEAVMVRSYPSGVSVALVYKTTAGAFILPANATRRWLWNSEVAS